MELASQAGTDKSYIYGIEGGHANTSIKLLARIADVFGIKLEELLKSSGR